MQNRLQQQKQSQEVQLAPPKKIFMDAQGRIIDENGQVVSMR
jgi:phage antirepressor YoqD-like protein